MPTIHSKSYISWAIRRIRPAPCSARFQMTLRSPDASAATRAFTTWLDHDDPVVGGHGYAVNDCRLLMSYSMPKGCGDCRLNSTQALSTKSVLLDLVPSLAIKAMPKALSDMAGWLAAYAYSSFSSLNGDSANNGPKSESSRKLTMLIAATPKFGERRPEYGADIRSSVVVAM